MPDCYEHDLDHDDGCYNCHDREGGCQECKGPEWEPEPTPYTGAPWEHS